MYTILISHSDEEMIRTFQNLCSGIEHIPFTSNPPTSFFRINTAKGIYNIPHKEILFVESAQKKSIIHTAGTSLILPIPFYRVRETLPASDFIQTHRSFLIHLKNVFFIDKTKEPWTISFFGSNKKAFVSRNYRKAFLQSVGPLLHCIPEKPHD